jgi:hypothetical protein
MVISRIKTHPTSAPATPVTPTTTSTTNNQILDLTLPKIHNSKVSSGIGQ